MNELKGENTFEDIKICIEIPPDMSEEAQKIAFSENPQNAEAIDNSSDRMALVTGKKWQPGRTLRVRFLDGDPVVQTKIAANETIYHYRHIQSTRTISGDGEAPAFGDRKIIRKGKTFLSPSHAELETELMN